MLLSCPAAEYARVLSSWLAADSSLLTHAGVLRLPHPQDPHVASRRGRDILQRLWAAQNARLDRPMSCPQHTRLPAAQAAARQRRPHEPARTQNTLATNRLPPARGARARGDTKRRRCNTEREPAVLWHTATGATVVRQRAQAARFKNPQDRVICSQSWMGRPQRLSCIIPAFVPLNICGGRGPAFSGRSAC